jgi:hypothetical protein
MIGISRAAIVRDKSSASKNAGDFTFPHRARMHLIVPDRGDHRRANYSSMSAVGAAGGARASGGRYWFRRRGLRGSPVRLRLEEAGAHRQLCGSLGVAMLTRLLGADRLVLGGYPAATRITRASILAIAAQIVGWSSDNGLRRSDNRRVALPFSITRAAARSRRARN